MKHTLTKTTVLVASLAFLNAAVYAADADQLLLPGADNPIVPSTPTTVSETAPRTTKNEYPEFWTGFYGGISIGGNFSSVNLHSNHFGFINPDGTCNLKSSIDSFFPGVQFGYSHQYNSNLVAGVEADFTYNVQERDNVTCPCPTFLRATDHFKVRNRLQGSLRGRLGYALDHNLLPFISAGISFADMGLDYTNEGRNSYSKSSTQVGWLVGGGLEWGFSHDLSVRAEYYYKAYDGLNMAIPTVYGFTDVNGAGRLNVHDNTVRVALNYWF